MANQPASQHEPTMEEILASIRKIISEDTTETPAAEAGDNSPEESDFLELTQEVPAEPEPAASSAAAVEPESENVDIKGAPEVATLEDDVVFQEIEEPTMNETVPSDEGIFSDKSRSALDDAFASLDEQGNAAPAPAYPLPEGDSVQAAFERAVRGGFEPLLREHLESHTDALMERMKPLVREWLDEHFPTLLENAVRTEVARVVKARGRR